MELNWSTFILEIVNFLVLVWILKRFLYQPVLDVIAARRKSIEDRLDEARAIEDEARALKGQYNGRLAEWEDERRRARQELMTEIERERADQLADLRATLDKEREKALVADRRRQAEQHAAVEQQALRQGAAFSGRLLEQAAGPELEDRLLNLLINDLEALPTEQRDRLREQCDESSSAIDVSSAFVLSEDQQQRLTAALQEVTGLKTGFRFRRDAELVAGLRVAIGAWVLAANVRDELEGFAELGRGRH